MFSADSAWSEDSVDSAVLVLDVDDSANSVDSALSVFGDPDSADSADCAVELYGVLFLYSDSECRAYQW